VYSKEQAQSGKVHRRSRGQNSASGFRICCSRTDFCYSMESGVLNRFKSRLFSTLEGAKEGKPLLA